MDAPVYPPQSIYVQPVAEPYVVSTKTLTIAELMAWPAAWKIVIKHMPKFAMTSSDQLKSVADNMRIADIGVFTQPIDTAALDAELQKLPASEGPKL